MDNILKNKNYNFIFSDNNLNLDEIYKKPYLLKIKINNYDDNNNIIINTEKVLTIKELSQSINDIVKKYDLIQHYIKCYNNDLYLHFDIKFISNGNYLNQFFSIKVEELKKMF
jgi:hypothetical protein